VFKVKSNHASSASLNYDSCEEEDSFERARSKKYGESGRGVDAENKKIIVDSLSELNSRKRMNGVNHCNICMLISVG
jgi:hypothetical protein